MPHRSKIIKDDNEDEQSIKEENDLGSDKEEIDENLSIQTNLSETDQQEDQEEDPLGEINSEDDKVDLDGENIKDRKMEFLREIKAIFDEMIYEHNDELDETTYESFTEELAVTMIDDKLRFYLENDSKYFIMELWIEYQEESGKYYAQMESDNFVNISKSVLFLTKTDLIDEKEQLHAHYKIMFTYYETNKDNEINIYDLMSQTVDYIQDSKDAGYIEHKVVIDPNENKELGVYYIYVHGLTLFDDPTPCAIAFEMMTYMLNEKYMMVILKGELNELSMTVKIYQDEDEKHKILQRLTDFVSENKVKEFSWKSVKEIVEKALDDIIKTENTFRERLYDLQLVPTIEGQELTETEGILQYEIIHEPEKTEDLDEALAVNFDFFMYKDEFMPSLYMNINSTVYQSEFLIPFMASTGEFKIFIEKSIKEIFSKIKTIVMNLSYMHEQPQIKTPKEKVISYIEAVMKQLNTPCEDGIQLNKVYEGKNRKDIPFQEDKVFCEPMKYFIIHDIIMEEKRPGFLVKCFNLQSHKGAVGEYRIYETNYYPWKKDFEEFARTCLIG